MGKTAKAWAVVDQDGTLVEISLLKENLPDLADNEKLVRITVSI